MVGNGWVHDAQRLARAAAGAPDRSTAGGGTLRTDAVEVLPHLVLGEDRDLAEDPRIGQMPFGDAGRREALAVKRHGPRGVLERRHDASVGELPQRLPAPVLVPRETVRRRTFTRTQYCHLGVEYRRDVRHASAPRCDLVTR